MVSLVERIGSQGMTDNIHAHLSAENADAGRVLGFRFTGNGWEYFKIWIVNVLLTVLTLGIYSAWAKVRTQQYFYGNTLLDDTSFRYTAKPVTILKGRIVAVAAFVLFSLAQELAPMLALAMLLLFIIAMPAIIVRAMAFKLGNSVHRNVAFGFVPNYRQAYAVFLAPTLALIVLMATFGFGAVATTGGNGSAAIGITIAILAYVLGLPFFAYIAAKFYVDNSRYGDSMFSYAGRAGGFYRVYGMSLLLGMGIVMLVAALLGALGSQAVTLMADQSTTGGVADPGQAMMLLLSQGIILLLLVPAYTVIYAYFQTQRFNLIYGNTVLAERYGFRARLTTAGMTWLYLSNLLIIVATLGLGVAWAKVRSARYHLGNLDFVASEDLDGFAAARRRNVSALGDEFGEVFDLEVGI